MTPPWSPPLAQRSNPISVEGTRSSRRRAPRSLAPLPTPPPAHLESPPSYPLRARARRAHTPSPATPGPLHRRFPSDAGTRHRCTHHAARLAPAPAPRRLVGYIHALFRSAPSRLRALRGCRLRQLFRRPILFHPRPELISSSPDGRRVWVSRPIAVDPVIDLPPPRSPPWWLLPSSPRVRRCCQRAHSQPRLWLYVGRAMSRVRPRLPPPGS